MNKTMKPNLVSFETCPFVQRSVIVLLEKESAFNTTYISLDNPPLWFLEMSPLGKVPVLEVGDVVLFESMVINEYLDETIPPSMQPTDPVQRALNRAWIEFATELFFSEYRLTTAPDKTAFETHQADTLKKLDQLESILELSPFFNGPEFSLIDAAFAPAFMRFDLLETWCTFDVYAGRPKVARWAEALRNRESVTRSVGSNFPEKYSRYINEKKSYAATVFC